MNNKTPDRAWKLLSKRGSWTQGKNAVDAMGHEVGSGSMEAVKFCALGSINKVYGSRSADAVVFKYTRLFNSIGQVWLWNDKPGQTRTNVVKTLKHFGI